VADQSRQEDPEARLPQLGDWDGPVFGTLGVLAADGDRVQCHCCGRWFKFLAAHVVQRHRLLADEYRAIFGLMRRTGLVGAATRAAKREAALPVLSQFWDSSPFKSASPEERSVWFRRRAPRRLEELRDPDHRAVRQRNMAKATESRRGRTGPDAPFRKAKARQLELLQDPAYRERMRRRNSEAHGGRVLVTCSICGTSFERTRSRLRGHRHTFCSEPCRREHLRRHGAESAQHMREIAAQRLPRVCVVCGASFEGVVQQKYCAPTCANRVYNGRVAGACALCGAAFAGHRGQRHCSPGCGARDRARASVREPLSKLDGAIWERLPAGERELIQRYIGLGGQRPWTLAELATYCGHTRRWVGRRVHAGIARLLEVDVVG